MLTKPVDAQIFFINRYFDILVKIAMICGKNISETPEVPKLINQLYITISDDMESLDTSDEYIHIRDELKELQTPEMIKSYFKR